MDLLVGQAKANESGNLHTSAPPRVIVAFDQLKDEQQRRVLAALERVEREGLDAAGSGLTRLGDRCLSTPCTSLRMSS